MIVQEKIVKVQVWDTAGQERYRSITNAYYRGAEAIMIVFDLTSKDTFNHIKDWITEVMKYTGEDIVIVVVGNKNDLTSNNINEKDIEIFEKANNLKILKLSAKTGNGVEDAFKYVVNEIIEKKKKKNTPNETTNKNSLNNIDNQKKKKCC